MRVVAAGGRRRPLTLRRSRGYVPAPLKLPVAAELALLACGAEQKSTFCLANGRRAWVSHHVGDLEHYSTLRAFQEGIAHFERLFSIPPAVVAHDLHPDYLSTAYALACDDVQLIGVQHHHAHLAAGLAEHGLRGPAVGAIFDGTGYGSDATVCGGEQRWTDWTETVMKAYQQHTWSWDINGLSMHSYTVVKWPPAFKSVGFGEDEYAQIIKTTLDMDDLIKKHSAIMD